MPPQEEGPRGREDPAPGGRARPRRRSVPRSDPTASRHGLLQGVQRATENQRGTIIPVEITIYEDRSFSFILKTPPTPALLRQAAGLEKGAGPRTRAGGTVTEPRSPRSPPPSCPTSTPTTSKRPSSRSPAPPVDGHRRRRLSRSRRTHELEENEEKPTCPGERNTRRASPSSTASSSTRRRGRRPGEGARPRPFDETVEVAVRLGVDPRKADQIVRGTLSLPAGTGRTLGSPCSRPARRRPRPVHAGADVVGADDLVDRVKRGSSTSTSPSPPPT